MESTERGLPEHADLMSIGDLADLTGIRPDTIRVWERRYGRPVPIRLPSGHRRYSQRDARWLRRIAEALAMGYRPSRVVRMGEADLDALLFPAAQKHDDPKQLTRYLDLARNLRDQRLATEMRRALKRLGQKEFLVKVISPLLDAVGRSWADGELEIRQEHLLSEVVEDVLRAARASIQRPSKGPRVILATLSGESHSLGLQMAAVICRIAGVPTRILGGNTPPKEIAEAAEEVGAAAVALSVSLATGSVETDRTIRSLRGMLRQDIHLVVGGKGARGARRGPRGVTYLQDFSAFEDWLKGLKRDYAKPR